MKLKLREAPVFLLKSNLESLLHSEARLEPRRRAPGATSPSFLKAVSVRSPHSPTGDLVRQDKRAFSRFVAWNTRNKQSGTDESRSGPPSISLTKKTPVNSWVCLRSYTLHYCVYVWFMLLSYPNTTTSNLWKPSSKDLSAGERKIFSPGQPLSWVNVYISPPTNHNVNRELRFSIFHNFSMIRYENKYNLKKYNII